MIVRIGKLLVNVLDAACPSRECYSLGFDKGSYTQGRGYTSYRTDAKGRRVEHPVCMTRHLRGCPINSVCSTCRLCSVEAVGGTCTENGCLGVLVERKAQP